jgi:prolyl-tRNA synthetase
MGSYGIGVTRAVAALAESNHDDRGLIWPRSVAPADVHVVAVGRGEEIFAEAERLAAELEGRGLTVMLDDRQKVSPGVKFGDAELIGVPTIVAVGKGLANGTLEVKDRRSGSAEDVPVAEAADYVVRAVRSRA